MDIYIYIHDKKDKKLWRVWRLALSVKLELQFLTGFLFFLSCIYFAVHSCIELSFGWVIMITYQPIYIYIYFPSGSYIEFQMYFFIGVLLAMSCWRPGFSHTFQHLCRFSVLIIWLIQTPADLVPKATACV